MSSDTVKAWIEDLEAESRLSAWERNFVESISDQFTNRGFLSENQQEKLKEVWERHQR